MKKKLISLLLALLLLTPWPVAYAYGHNTAERESARIEAATPDAAPHWKAYRNAIGGIIPGDLFYVDNVNGPNDMQVTLNLTNTDELIRHYRYLILCVGVYMHTGADGWERVTTADGERLPDNYITMLNGRLSFNLPGHAKYKITLDKGSYYSYGTRVDDGAAAPIFYLSAG